MDALDIALTSLGQSLGLPDLAFARDECQLEIGGVLVDFTADRTRQRLVLTSLLGEFEDAHRGVLLPRLLDANGRASLGRAAVGVPAGGNAVILADEVPARGLDAAEIEATLAAFLAAFLAAADSVRDLLDPGALRPAVPDAAGDSPPGYDVMVLRP